METSTFGADIGAIVLGTLLAMGFFLMMLWFFRK
jgi:hypothetical protein